MLSICILCYDVGMYIFFNVYWVQKTKKKRKIGNKLKKTQIM